MAAKHGGSYCGIVGAKFSATPKGGTCPLCGRVIGAPLDSAPIEGFQEATQQTGQTEIAGTPGVADNALLVGIMNLLRSVVVFLMLSLVATFLGMTGVAAGLDDGGTAFLALGAVAGLAAILSLVFGYVSSGSVRRSLP